MKGQTINFTDFLVKRIEYMKDKNFDFIEAFKLQANFKIYFYEILFGGTTLFPTVLKPNVFKKGNSSNLTDLHPITVSFFGDIFIKGGVNFYITQELYEKKTFDFQKGSRNTCEKFNR